MKRSILIMIIIACNMARAQDPHFSQYYASQTTVNPASSGLFTGDLRVSGLYRQQWPQYGDAFVTGTVAVEWKPDGFREGQNSNRLSVGGLLLYDKTPDGVLKSQHAYATIAYHKALDAAGNHKLGLGFMGGYNQKSIDPSHLSFGNQFGSGGFNPGTGGDNISANSLSSFDLHTGIIYSYEDEEKLLYAGASVYHLLQPKDYFISDAVLDHVPRRYNLHAGLNLAGNHVQWAGSVLYMRQLNVSQLMIGGAVGFPFGTDGLLYAGSWYRTGGSVIPTINLQWNQMNLGLSYDTYTGNKVATIKPKSLELSLSCRFLRYHDEKTGCFAF